MAYYIIITMQIHNTVAIYLAITIISGTYIRGGRRVSRGLKHDDTYLAVFIHTVISVLLTAT